MNKLAVLLLCPALMCAQNITRLVRLQYADPDRVARLVSGPVIAMGDPVLRAVVIRGDADKITSVEQMIKELDVPAVGNTGRNVELVIYVIGASYNAQEATQGAQQIEPVVKQLKSIFPYSSYRLLDTMMMRSREHARSTGSRGIMRTVYEVKGLTAPTPYTVDFQDVGVSSEGSKRAVHLDRFKFSSKIAVPEGSIGGTTTQWAAEDLGIEADVDINEGQKAVVGNTDIGGDSALFVVLTARVLD